MKLMELTGIKQLKNQDPKQILDFITSQNSNGKTKLRVLGNGSNGVALTDGTNVFKFWHRDGSYENFVKFARGHSWNKFLPVFKSPVRKLPINITSTKGGDSRTGVWFVKMEMLQPLVSNYALRIFKDDALEKMTLKNKPANYATLDSILGVVEYTKFKGDKKKIIFKMLNQVATENGFVKKGWFNTSFKLEEFSEDLFLFMETIFELYNAKSGTTDFLDLHRGNFAMRGKQLVIIDPYANNEDLDINKDILKTLNGNNTK